MHVSLPRNARRFSHCRLLYAGESESAKPVSAVPVGGIAMEEFQTDYGFGQL